MSKASNTPFPYIHNEGHSVTVVIDGRAATVSSGQVNYKLMAQALKDGRYDDVRALFNPDKVINKYLNGLVVVEGDDLYYKGMKIGNPVVDRITTFLKRGEPCEPLLKLLQKLMDNPSKHSVEMLYNFMEHKNLPITADGNFLGYKSVDPQYNSWSTGSNQAFVSTDDGVTWTPATGKLPNKVGNTIKVPRNQVADNPNAHCSSGLHVGSLEYASTFRGGSNIVIVEVNPAHVVSVPNDCGCQKLRAEQYKVVADYVGPLSQPLVDSTNLYGEIGSTANWIL